MLLETVATVGIPWNFYSSNHANYNPKWHTWTTWDWKYFLSPFHIDCFRTDTILLLSSTKLTIYNTLHMSSYTTASWSVNKFSRRAALYQMVTSAPLTQRTSSHHCENEYNHLCVGVFPCEHVAIQYREKPLTELWSDTQYNQCGQSMSDKPEYIMKPTE